MYSLKEQEQQYILKYNNEEIEQFIKKDNVIKMKCLENYAVVYKIDKEINYCDFYKDGCYVYSLKRNDYRPPKDLFLEFFKNKQNKIVFIFNIYHGIITVHDADTGKIISSDKQNDKFLTDYKVVIQSEKRYLYLEGWWWNPIFFCTIYDIDKLINNSDNYKPIIIDTWMYEESEYKFNKETDKFEIKQLNKEYIIEDIIKDKDPETNENICEMIKSSKQMLLFKENKNSDILLKRIIEKYNFFDYNKIFNEDILKFSIKAIGKNSNEHLSEHDNLLIEKIRYNLFEANNNREPIYENDTIKDIIVKYICQSYTKKIPLLGGKISLIFKIRSSKINFDLHIDQTLKKMGESRYYEYDFELPLNIHLELV